MCDVIVIVSMVFPCLVVYIYATAECPCCCRRYDSYGIAQNKFELAAQTKSITNHLSNSLTSFILNNLVKQWVGKYFTWLKSKFVQQCRSYNCRMMINVGETHEFKWSVGWRMPAQTWSIATDLQRCMDIFGKRNATLCYLHPFRAQMRHKVFWRHRGTCCQCTSVEHSSEGCSYKLPVAPKIELELFTLNRQEFCLNLR